MGFQRGQQTLVIILLVISGVTGRSSSFNIHVLFLVLPKADLRQGLECRSDIAQMREQEKWGRKNGRTGPKHHGADAPGKAWTRGSGGQALQLACLLGENDSGLFHAVSQRQDSMEASEGPQANTFIELSVSFFLSASLFRLLSKVFLAALSN